MLIMLILFFSIISILILRYILMNRGYRHFVINSLPLLNRLKAYFDCLEKNLLSHDQDRNKLLEEKKADIIQVLSSSTLYPEWVFGSLLNKMLARGYRFFLLRLDAMIELVLILHKSFLVLPNFAFFYQLKNETLFVVTHNAKLFNELLAIFNNPSLSIDNQNENDLQRLENSIDSLLPAKIPISQRLADDDFLIHFLENMRDLRKELLDLIKILKVNN